MPAKATAPATTAANTARRRKYSASSGSSSRRASHTKYTAERNAQVAMASRPPMIEVGLSQLDHGSPASPPDGTWPEAMAPATLPMQYGTSTEDSANAAPKFRRSRIRRTALRKAKLEPRSTIPSAASVSGTNRVSVMDANASANDVHNTTRQKMSHTWFASHTGPIEWSINARGRSPRSAP